MPTLFHTNNFKTVELTLSNILKTLAYINEIRISLNEEDFALPDWSRATTTYKLLLSQCCSWNKRLESYEDVRDQKDEWWPYDDGKVEWLVEACWMLEYEVDVCREVWEGFEDRVDCGHEGEDKVGNGDIDEDGERVIGEQVWEGYEKGFDGVGDGVKVGNGNSHGGIEEDREKAIDERRGI